MPQTELLAVNSPQTAQNVHLPFRVCVLIFNGNRWRAAMLRMLAISAFGLMVSLAAVSSALATVTQP
jgi:hypothetical protein